MRAEAAERHRLDVRLPGQLVVGHPLEQLPRRGDFVIVFREQTVFDHEEPHRLCPECSAVLGQHRMPRSAHGRGPRPPSAALPQISGTIVLDGLAAPVRVVRDRWGVPHITAENQDDLFFAQGFVQAQDRLFQMDLWRRSVQGRLSEVLGANFIERDAMTRRVQYRGDLDGEWASYGAGHEGDRRGLHARHQRLGRRARASSCPRSSCSPAGCRSSGAPKIC